MADDFKSIIKTAVILLIIGFVCTVILSLCNYATAPVIAELAEKSENDAMKEVAPFADSFEKADFADDGIVNSIYKAKSGDEISGYCVNVSPSGYGGEISMMVGIEADLKVTGVKIISMSETPGLGAKANEVEFTEQYIGTGEGVAVIKSGTPKDNEIKAISGATITSKAVTSGVASAVDAVKNLK